MQAITINILLLLYIIYNIYYYIKLNILSLLIFNFYSLNSAIKPVIVVNVINEYSISNVFSDYITFDLHKVIFRYNLYHFTIFMIFPQEITRMNFNNN